MAAGGPSDAAFRNLRAQVSESAAEVKCSNQQAAAALDEIERLGKRLILQRKQLKRANQHKKEAQDRHTVVTQQLDQLKPRLQFLPLPQDVSVTILRHSGRHARARFSLTCSAFNALMDLATSKGLFSVQLVAVAASLAHTVLCTAQGAVYACGKANGGKLGHNDDSPVPRPIKISRCVVGVAATPHFTVMRTDQGEVYQCGAMYGFPSQHVPSRVDSLSDVRVTQLSADTCSEQLIFVTELGKVGTYLAQTGGCTYINLPLSTIDKRVVCASLSSLSGVICTHGGSVYTFVTATGLIGNNLRHTNRSGQLGHGDDQVPAVAYAPKLVNAMVGTKAVCVAAGKSATAACTEDGELWTWGDAKAIGRIGWDMSTNKGYDPVPRVCDSLAGVHVTRVTAGGGTSVLCTTDQGIYAFGDKDFGKLGLGKLSGGPVLLPHKVEGLAGKIVTNIAVSEVHSVVCDSNGDVFTFGQSGNKLGYDSPGHQRVPKMLDSFLEI